MRRKFVFRNIYASLVRSFETPKPPVQENEM